ncbi:EscU/YscU/HrcU family type III secretion system export apparatus switch protein [Yoonia sp. MH D7]
MSEEADDDKQFEASQKKLDDARKKGETAKSNDLTTAASYGGMVIAVAALGGGTLIATGSALKTLLDQADAIALSMFSGNPGPLLIGIMASVAMNMAPWFVIPALLALLSLIARRAIIFAPDKIVPKLSRISPISGFKNKFGRQGLFEFVKSFAKLVIYGVVLGIYLSGQMDRIIATMHLAPGMIVVELGRLTVGLMLIVLAVSATIGIIDYVWQFAEHQRKHRMSRKEMMDEMKQSEGDPMFKQQRRQKGIELAMNKMLADVPTADVVIVNPTHYAVALKWDRNSIGAPLCVAKGVDEIAARIRETAMQHGVTIHSDPPTARSLYATVDIGSEIAPDDYAAVAAAIRFAESMREKARHI